MRIEYKRTRKLQATPTGKKWIQRKEYWYTIPSGYVYDEIDLMRVIEYIQANKDKMALIGYDMIEGYAHGIN